MISSTLGAPLGGTTRGGHQGFESLEFSLITPPNFGGGAGIAFPSIVVVALGEPSVPVTFCAEAGAPASVAANRDAAIAATAIDFGRCLMLGSPRGSNSTSPVAEAGDPSGAPRSIFQIGKRGRFRSGWSGVKR